MNSFRIGFTSTTFKKKSIEQIISIARKAGVEYIEWGENYHINTPEDAKKAKALCDEEKIKICSYGSYYRVGSNDDTARKRICKIASIMGAESIRVWLGRKNSEETSNEEYLNLLADAKALCAEAEKYGLIICPECHDHTYNNNTDAFLKFAKELGRTNFATYYQSRYFRFEYDLDRIERTYNYIKDVHISFSEVRREQRFRKRNSKYLPTILEKLKEKGFGGIVMIEFTAFSSEKCFIGDVKKLRKF